MTASPHELSSVLGAHLDSYDLTGLNLPNGPSFYELAQQAVRGEMNLSLGGVMESGASLFFSELWVNNQLIKQLLMVAVLSALLKCLSDAFHYKSAGELGFYISYIMMVLLAFSSFQLTVGILTGTVASLNTMMESSVPLITGLMAVSGNITGAAVLHPALIFAVGLITRFVSEIFIPLVMAAAALTVVNQLVEGGPLTKLALLVKKVADWMLKGIITLFALLLTLQKISVPIVNNLAVKTAKAAAGAVPVVGGALNSAMDTVLYWGSAMRSGTLVALVAVICAAVAAPLVKMLAVMFVYRVVAALAQPICDDRFVGCVDQIGLFMGLLLSAGVMVAVMFIYAAVILLSF